MSEESTTPDLVELTRGFVEAANRRYFDAVESFYAPDAALCGAEIGTFEGAAAIRGLFEDMLTPHEQSETEAEEILDLGSGVVFAVLKLTARPVGSSGEVQLRWASVAISTEGLIERMTNYMDINEARAAAERLAESRE
jgi:ketosteroid isomerase-like protein